MMITPVFAAARPLKRLTRAGGTIVLWFATCMPLLALGPATARLPARQGYLLYPQAAICQLGTPARASQVISHSDHQSTADAEDAPPRARFRPRVTKDAVLPMSAVDVLYGRYRRANGD